MKNKNNKALSVFCFLLGLVAFLTVQNAAAESARESPYPIIGVFCTYSDNDDLVFVSVYNDAGIAVSCPDGMRRAGHEIGIETVIGAQTPEKLPYQKQAEKGE